MAQLAEQLTHSQEVDHDIREWVSLIQGSKGIERFDCELLKYNGRAEDIGRLSGTAGNHHYQQLCEAN